MDDKALEYIENMPEDVLRSLSMIGVAWQYDEEQSGYRDPDTGKTLADSEKDDSSGTRQRLQQVCWEKTQQNPYINTALRGMAGRMAGSGFSITSEISKIQSAIEETELDPRNELWNNYPKLAMRSLIEGELFQLFTVHNDGFVEIDFIDPTNIAGGENNDGIIVHSTKQNMPLLYRLKNNNGGEKLVPSIYLALYPNLLMDAAEHKDYDKQILVNQTSDNRFQEIGGFSKFIVSWNKGWFTTRNISHIRTVLYWIQLYEDLKKWEADYKKSASSYVWCIQITDPKMFKIWLSMTDEQRRSTALAAKKTPGATIVLPLGCDMKVLNPTLPKISDDDKDIRQIITAGVGEPEDVTTSASTGPFASVKASRGPFSDRIADEVTYWRRFLRYGYWRHIFFLKNKVAGFPLTFSREECTGFKKKVPQFGNIKRKPEQCLEINVPISEIIDIESRARAMLGVKHGPVVDTMGLPLEEVAKRLGFGNYRRLRQWYETEQKKYPRLILTMDAEGLQEKTQAEPSKQNVRKTNAGN